MVLKLPRRPGLIKRRALLRPANPSIILSASGHPATMLQKRIDDQPAIAR